jgi:large subunit ribosomal protein L19
MNYNIAEIEKRFEKKDIPGGFQVGDVVDVHQRIKEAEDKVRVQVFSGTVIMIKGRGRGVRSTFTVRRIVAGEGVERIFPYHCPTIAKVVVKRPGRVRRSRLFYLRGRVGKATKVKERRLDESAEAPAEAAESTSAKKSETVAAK